MNRVYPITMNVLAYGPSTNVNKIRKVLKELMEEENGKLSKAEEADLIKAAPAEEIAQHIAAILIEPVEKIAKAGPSQIGLIMTMPELNERITNLELQEIQVAKTCTCVCTWDSQTSGLRQQIAWVRGDKISTERPL